MGDDPKGGGGTQELPRKRCCSSWNPSLFVLVLKFCWETAVENCLGKHIISLITFTHF